MGTNVCALLLREGLRSTQVTQVRDSHLPPRTGGKPITLYSTVLGASIGAVLLTPLWIYSTSDSYWRQRHAGVIETARALTGRPESRVIQVLGSPYRVYSSDATPPGTASTNEYPVEGYAAPPYSVEHRALVYIKGELILYVYVNAHGQVVRTWVGPS